MSIGRRNMAGKTDTTRHAVTGRSAAIGTGVGMYSYTDEPRTDLREIIRAILAEELPLPEQVATEQPAPTYTTAIINDISPWLNYLADYLRYLERMLVHLTWRVRALENKTGGGINVYKRVSDHASDATYNCYKQDWVAGAWANHDVNTQIVHNVEEAPTGHACFGNAYFASLGGTDTTGIMPAIPLQGTEVYKIASLAAGDGEYNCNLQTVTTGALASNGGDTVLCKNLFESSGHIYAAWDTQVFIRVGMPASGSAVPVVPLLLDIHVATATEDAGGTSYIACTIEGEAVTVYPRIPTGTVLLNCIPQIKTGQTFYVYNAAGTWRTLDRFHDVTKATGIVAPPRRGFVKAQPTSQNTVECYLDEDESGTPVSVVCDICDASGIGATFSSPTIPVLADGFPMWIAQNHASVWHNVTPIFVVEECP